MRGGDGRRRPRKASARHSRVGASPRKASALRTALLCDPSCAWLLVGSGGPPAPPGADCSSLAISGGEAIAAYEAFDGSERTAGESERGSRCATRGHAVTLPVRYGA